MRNGLRRTRANRLNGIAWRRRMPNGWKKNVRLTANCLVPVLKRRKHYDSWKISLKKMILFTICVGNTPMAMSLLV